jgi:hypothetical protein
MRTALANQLQSELAGTANPVIPGLTVNRHMHHNPTPPYIDVYPDPDEFVLPMGFGAGNDAYWFLVRARVNPTDTEGQQDLLDSMMDGNGAASVEQALFADPSLGGAATMRTVEGPSGYSLFGRAGEELIGVTWRVLVIP